MVKYRTGVLGRKTASIVLAVVILLTNATSAQAADTFSGSGTYISCGPTAFNWSWFGSLVSYNVTYGCTAPMSVIRAHVYIQRQWGFWFWQWEVLQDCGTVYGGPFYPYSVTCSSTANSPDPTSNHQLVNDYYLQPPPGAYPAETYGTGKSPYFHNP